MFDDALGWILVASVALVLVLAVILARVASRLGELKSRVTELEQQIEVTSAVAAHPKEPHERLVGVVINATKVESDRVGALVEAACRDAGMPDPLVMSTTPHDPGHAMARQALEAGCDVVLAAGGDGTVRAVATELGGTETALGVIPLGTGNLFARNIGLPHTDLTACVNEGIHGTAHRVDTLQLTLQRPSGKQEKEVSLVIAGGGLDAEVMESTRDVLKQHAGWLAYGEAGLRHVLGPRRSISVSLDEGAPSSFRVRSVLLANCGTLQGGMRLIPTAHFDDGHMDTVLFTPRHPFDWARLLAKTALRLHSDIPMMTVRQARTGRVTMAEPMPFQIDGDAVGEVSAVKADIAHEAIIVNGVSEEVLAQPQDESEQAVAG